MIEIHAADSRECFSPIQRSFKTEVVDKSLHFHYRKWLRYFLDFRRKYPPPEAKSEQVRLFTDKLKSKKQNPRQYTQAAHAISLFLESQEHKSYIHPTSVEDKEPLPARLENQGLKANKTNNTVVTSNSYSSMPATAIADSSPSYSSPGGKRYNKWRCLEKTKSKEWDHAIEKLAAEIKIRHYSRKTLKAYADWGRKFQRYLRGKPPHELSSIDVKEYLTYLAVQSRVASSTQNQAFNALLFLFRHTKRV